MGWVAIKRGELDQARRYIEQGLEDIRQSGDQELECVALRFLGRLEVAEGQPRQALHTYQDALAIAKTEGFEAAATALNSDLAYWEMEYGTLAEAEKYIRAAISGFEELNDIVRASDRSMMLANILVRREKYSEAEKTLLPVLDRIETEVGQLEAVAAGYACLAHIRVHQDRTSEAKECCARSKQIYDKIGMHKERFPIGLPAVCIE
jgi:tetratricopeptide (TPR) repeat protein